MVCVTSCTRSRSGVSVITMTGTLNFTRSLRRFSRLLGSSKEGSPLVFGLAGRLSEETGGLARREALVGIPTTSTVRLNAAKEITRRYDWEPQSNAAFG